MDYSTYFLSKKEMMVCIGKGILAGMLAAWILYQSVYGMVTVFIFIPLCIQREKKKRREQQKETLLLQFRDAMQSVAAALQAGYSMENAWRESEKEMTELYGQDGIFVGELHQINQAQGFVRFFRCIHFWRRRARGGRPEEPAHCRRYEPARSG